MIDRQYNNLYITNIFKYGMIHVSYVKVEFTKSITNTKLSLVMVQEVDIAMFSINQYYFDDCNFLTHGSLNVLGHGSTVCK